MQQYGFEFIAANVLPRCGVAARLQPQAAREALEYALESDVWVWPDRALEGDPAVVRRVVSAHVRDRFRNDGKYGVIGMIILTAVIYAVVEYLVTWWLENHVHRSAIQEAYMASVRLPYRPGA
jgi:hypothetical protein